MKKPMRKYHSETPVIDKVGFLFSPRRKALMYAEYGVVKTYANITQAERKVAELRQQGYDVYRSFDHPFVILKEADVV